MASDHMLQEIRDRIVKYLAKADHAIVNVVAAVSLNELLHGVAALLGPCSLIRLESEPLGRTSIQKLSSAWSMPQPVVLGCLPSQELPAILFGAYNDVYRFGESRTVLPDLGFPLKDQHGGLKDLVLLLLRGDDRTPNEFRESLVYIVLGEHEAKALAEAGRENDSSVERVGEF